MNEGSAGSTPRGSVRSSPGPAGPGAGAGAGAGARERSGGHPGQPPGPGPGQGQQGRKMSPHHQVHPSTRLQDTPSRVRKSPSPAPRKSPSPAPRTSPKTNISPKQTKRPQKLNDSPVKTRKSSQNDKTESQKTKTNSNDIEKPISVNLNSGDIPDLILDNIANMSINSNQDKAQNSTVAADLRKLSNGSAGPSESGEPLKQKPPAYNRSISEPPEEVVRFGAGSPGRGGEPGAGRGSRTSLASSGDSTRSADLTFSINKHRPVDLASFEPPTVQESRTTTPRKRELRFSHGEDRQPPDHFDSNLIKKAASVAHVEQFSKTVRQGTLRGAGERGEAGAGAGLEGRQLLQQLAASFSSDSCLRLSLTSQDCLFIARQLGGHLLGLGVLRSTDTQDTTSATTVKVGQHCTDGEHLLQNGSFQSTHRQ